MLCTCTSTAEPISTQSTKNKAL